MIYYKLSKPYRTHPINDRIPLGISLRGIMIPEQHEVAHWMVVNRTQTYPVHNPMSR